MKGQVNLYRDRKGEWRWRAVARNGRKIANCGEGYRRRVDAMRFAVTIACAFGLALEIEKPSRR